MRTFAELALSKALLDAVATLGFEEPTPVQEAVIPVLLEGRRNLMALAQTGTGKTAAFGLPLLERIDRKHKAVQAVVLCPTRELCLQVSRDIRDFALHMKGLQVAAVYGGASISGQIRSLKMGSHVLVATPGRLHDLLRRNAADLSGATCVVLDEADEMLGMGFEEDLTAIMAAIPSHVQKLLFSATMPRSLAALVQAFVENPLEIAIGPRGAGASTVEHHVYLVQERDRYEALRRIVDAEPDIYGLVFCRTRQETQDVADALVRDGYRADSLHGDLSQLQRDRVMQTFAKRQIRLLVATNVAARGLDISKLDHVISFRLPDALEGYTHRSGRTGRAGRSGISSVLITPRERSKIPAIERSTGCRFLVQTVPDGQTVCAVRIAAWLERMRADEAGEARIAPFMKSILAQLERMPRDELVARILSAQFADLLEHYRGAPDLNLKMPAAGRSAGAGGRRRPVRGGKGRPTSGGGGRGASHAAARRPAAAGGAGGLRRAGGKAPAARATGETTHKPRRRAISTGGGGTPPAKGRPAPKAEKPRTGAKRSARKHDAATPDWVRDVMQGGKGVKSVKGKKGKGKKK